MFVTKRARDGSIPHRLPLSRSRCRRQKTKNRGTSPHKTPNRVVSARHEGVVDRQRPVVEVEHSVGEVVGRLRPRRGGSRPLVSLHLPNDMRAETGALMCVNHRGRMGEFATQRGRRIDEGDAIDVATDGVVAETSPKNVVVATVAAITVVVDAITEVAIIETEFETTVHGGSGGGCGGGRGGGGGSGGGGVREGESRGSGNEARVSVARVGVVFTFHSSWGDVKR